MTTLPERCCSRCFHWTRDNPDDLSAPEGKCGLPNYPGAWPAYWPHTLQRDLCGTFLSQKKADLLAEKIIEEETREDREANGQFGVGA